MNDYRVSSNLKEISERHPFPWNEQRISSPKGVLVQLLDASGREVPIPEIAAMCRIVTMAHVVRAAQEGRTNAVPDSQPN